jgi:hypothetical protein
MDIEQRVAALEARLRTAEDQLEIIRLLNAYGPLVDSGEGHAAAQLWTKDGVFDMGSVRRMSADELAAACFGEAHRELIDNGSAHFTGTPYITVNGDSAEAVGYAFLVRKEAERWFIYRATANYWTLTRTPKGWRIAERCNRLLDGSEDSHEILRRVKG